MEDREQAAAQLAETREQVGRMTRNPLVLRTSVSEDAKPLWKELLIAGMAHEKAIEDWRPYCERRMDKNRTWEFGTRWTRTRGLSIAGDAKTSGVFPRTYP